MLKEQHKNGSIILSTVIESTNTVAHYAIVKTLGEGSFGSVKLATHTITGESVAIKIIAKASLRNKADKKRISREIKILKASNHRHIIKMYEILESATHFYIVMEYASMGELFSYIVQLSKLNEKTAANLFRQMLSGLEYLHTIGFVHRDIKPENILLDKNMEIKIADFGLSNSYINGELLNTCCGSPCYAPPEMITGKPYRAESTDIWSIGIVLYVMLSGSLPFEVLL